MKTTLKITIIFGIISSVFYFNKTSSKENFEEVSSLYKLTKEEKNKLQEGDIILRKGFGFISNMIAKLLEEDLDLTHIGLLVKKNNQWKVAHVLSSSVSNQEGIRLQSIDSFVDHSKKNSLVISRLKNIKPKQQKKIKQQISYYLHKKIKFDHAFDYKDSTKFYCSELVWRIYEHNLAYLNIPDSVSFHKKYNTLKTFYNPEYFDIIVNHQE